MEEYEPEISLLNEEFELSIILYKEYIKLNFNKKILL